MKKNKNTLKTKIKADTKSVGVQLPVMLFGAGTHEMDFYERQLKIEKTLLNLHRDHKAKFMELYDVCEKESVLISRRLQLTKEISELFGIEGNEKDKDTFNYIYMCFHYPHTTWTGKREELIEHLNAWVRAEKASTKKA